MLAYELSTKYCVHHLARKNIIFTAILSFEMMYTNSLIIILAGDWSPTMGYQPACIGYVVHITYAALGLVCIFLKKPLEPVV